MPRKSLKYYAFCISIPIKIIFGSCNILDSISFIHIKKIKKPMVLFILIQGNVEEEEKKL